MKCEPSFRMAFLLVILASTFFCGCSSQPSDESLLASLNDRCYQIPSIWYGDVSRWMTADGEGYGGRNQPWGLRYVPSPANYQLTLPRAHEQPRVFLPALESSDPEVVLSALWLIDAGHFPSDNLADQASIAAVIRQKCSHHADARIRWECHQILWEWHQWRTEDFEAIMSDSDTALRDFAPFAAREVCLHMAADSNLQDAKLHYVEACIKHMADEDWAVRQAATSSLVEVLEMGVSSERWKVLNKEMPHLPNIVAYTHCDWNTRQATQKVWQDWWQSHKEAAMPTAAAPAPETQPGTLWGDETEHFKMSLSVSSLTLNAMEPLIATVVIKNNAKEKQGFFWIGGFAITVRNESNETMPTTRYGKAAQENSFVDPRTISWDSGESQTFQMVINRERDMTVQGTYSISISVPVLRDKENAPKLVSNVIKVKLSDFQPPTTEPETHEALASPPK